LSDALPPAASRQDDILCGRRTDGWRWDERLVGQRFLDFFHQVADLGRQGSLRLDAKIFLVFVEGAGGVA
jgi:hypothetical protein